MRAKRFQRSPVTPFKGPFGGYRIFKGHTGVPQKKTILGTHKKDPQCEETAYLGPLDPSARLIATQGGVAAPDVTQAAPG